MYLIRLRLGNILIYFLKKCVKRVKVIYGVLKPGSVRGVVPGFVQCTRLSYSKINCDSVIIEDIDTYVFDKCNILNYFF